jgi:hypothetical protein
MTPGMKLNASRVIPNARVKRDANGIKIDKWNPSLDLDWLRGLPI